MLRRPFLRHVLLLALLLLSLAAPAWAQVWTQATPLPTPRSGLSAVVLEGQLYALGGRDAEGNVLDVVERYDPQTNTWTTGLASLREARYNAAAVVYQGTLLLLGGRDDEDEVMDDVEQYDPVQDRWISFEDLDTEREGLAAVVLDDAVYVMGGSDEDGRLLDTVAYYDAAEEEWVTSSTWQLDQPRAALAATGTSDAVYALGGYSLFGPSAAVQRYHPSEGSTVPTALPTPRGNLSAASRGTTLYALGGRDAANQVVRLVETYDTAANTWSTAPLLNLARENFAAAVLQGRLYVVGGADAGGLPLSSVEALSVGTGPTAQDDTAETDEDTPLTLAVLDNDADADGDPLTITAFTQPTLGQVEALGEGQLRFTPTPDRFGTTQFTYTITDALHGTATATVTITIHPVNDPPVFASTPDTSAVEGAPYTYVLDLFDADGDVLNVTAPLLPSWLALVQQDTTYTLTGTPGNADIGLHAVILWADDGTVVTENTFSIDVALDTALGDGPALTFALAPAFPNPFRQQVTLPFLLDAAGPVEMAIYDLTGRRVALLAQTHLAAGPHTLRWDGRDAAGQPLAAGVYLYRLRQGTRQHTRTLVYRP